MESFGEPCRDRNEPSQSAIAKMEGRLWTPVYTKPNQEHRLFDFTQNSGIRSYLPLIRKMGLSRGCRKIVQHPMFRLCFLLCEYGGAQTSQALPSCPEYHFHG